MLPQDGRFAAVGPLIVPDESCCYECLLRRRAANLDYGEDLGDLESTPLACRGEAALDRVAAAVAAHVVRRFTVGRDTTVVGILFAIETAPAPSITDHPVLRVPRCPVCSHVERRAAPLPWHSADAA